MVCGLRYYEDIVFDVVNVLFASKSTQNPKEGAVVCAPFGTPPDDARGAAPWNPAIAWSICGAVSEKGEKADE